NTHQWHAILLANMGRFDEGIREANRAVELDYFSLVTSTQLGNVLYRARLYDQAIAVLRKTLDLEPSFSSARAYLGLCYLMKGSHEEARAEFQRGREAAPNSPDFVALLGYAYGRAGEGDRARRCKEELDEMAARGVYVSP